jgi:hypothetical protein
MGVADDLAGALYGSAPVGPPAPLPTPRPGPVPAGTRVAWDFPDPEPPPARGRRRPWRLRRPSFRRPRRRWLAVLGVVAVALGVVGALRPGVPVRPHPAGNFLLAADGRVLGCVRVLPPGFLLQSFGAGGDFVQFKGPGLPVVHVPLGSRLVVLWWLDGSTVWGSSVASGRSTTGYEPTHPVTAVVGLPLGVTPSFLPLSMTLGRSCAG